MNNNVRTVIAAVLSMIILILWQQYFSKSTPTNNSESHINKEKAIDEFKFDNTENLENKILDKSILDKPQGEKVG